MSCDDVRDLLAPLSLDALDADERDGAEDHVARCPTCTAELREYRETAAWLALSFHQHEPPARLRGRLMAAVADGALGSTAVPRPRRWFLPRLPRFQPAALAAGLALIVAVSTVLWAAGLQSQLNEQRTVTERLRDRADRFDRVVRVLQAPELQLRPLEGSQLAPGATGRLYVDPETGEGMMSVRSLPPLPSGRAYQLWWVRPDGRREDGGLLTWTDQHGNAYRLLKCPGPVNSFQAVGLTDEPAAGSPAPTGQRLLGGSL